jgi:arylsulfatase A-like enzyme
MDLSASILAAAGATVPADAQLEGINIFPILVGRAPVVERTLFWRTNTGGHNQRAVRSGDWKLMVDGNHFLVFDVRKDVGERNDVANERQDLARRLRSQLTAWEADVTAEAQTNGTVQINRGRGAGGGGGPTPGGRGAGGGG